MKNVTLHIIVDPLCGWTYGSVPLITAAENIDGLIVKVHSGGMLTGDNVKPVTPAWREFALKNDSVIAKKTGQVFGSNYTDGLLKTNDIILNSAPAITAILAAQKRLVYQVGKCLIVFNMLIMLRVKTLCSCMY